jgi:hypothetical protein
MKRQLSTELQRLLPSGDKRRREWTNEEQHAHSRSIKLAYRSLHSFV